MTPQWVVEGKAGGKQNDLNEALEQSTYVNEYESIAETAQGRAVDNDYSDTPPRDHAQAARDEDSVRAKYAVGAGDKGDLVQVA